MTLTTLIAELEEAERAANLNGDDWVVRYENIGPDDNPNLIAFLEEGSDEGRILCIDEDPRGDELPSPALHFIALMRTHLPAVIEAVKRQGEALEQIAKGKYGKCPIEGHWPPEKPCTLCGDLGFFDDEPQYNPAKDGHCVEGGARVIARAALKEATDAK